MHWVLIDVKVVVCGHCAVFKYMYMCVCFGSGEVCIMMALQTRSACDWMLTISGCDLPA